MKFTLSWLKTHLETDASVAELSTALTMLGLEVEQIVDAARELAPFVVAYVESADQHPNADRLKVCRVNTGKETLQVVCGAPNARAGMKGVFAPVGTTIPGTGLLLKASKIRSVESNGMLCSYRELKLGEDHSGIIDLPADVPVGASAATVLGVDDPMFEIKLTPNRGDCLGVVGIARDLAAAGLGRLKPADLSPLPGTFGSPLVWRREAGDAEEACPLVVGRYFRNVKNGPSPEWLQQRLKAIGLRPISALVDITNFFTFDLNRPLHVFDADKLSGDPAMRMARAGEKIVALDGRTYELDPSMLVIADKKGVHGIAGVMGGEDSGCSDATTSVFLEVAYFEPVRVAATGRKLGIQSDARYRFERGIDPESCRWGAEAATRLLLELCGGEASEIVSAGEMPAYRRHYTFRPERVKALGGLELDAAKGRTILQTLGFAVDGQDVWTVTPPSWRPDIVGEADLVEEIVRVHGYDHVPAVPLPRQAPLSAPARTPAQRRPGQVRRGLAVRGLFEAVTSSFMSSRNAALFGGVADDLRLSNPMSADLDAMRVSILPNMLEAAARNLARGQRDFGLFEVGPQYAGREPDDQALVAAGVRVGNTGTRHWTAPTRAVDAFDAKADALAAIATLGLGADALQVLADAPAWYHPGRSGTLRLGPNVLAWFGEIHPSIVEHFDLRTTAVGFEVFVDRVPMPKPRPGKARPPLKLSPFQPIDRDFAFIVDEAVSAEALVRAVRGADRALIAAVSVFDVYAGKGVEPGKKSIALAVTLQPVDRTLTDADIEAVSGKIVAQAAKVTGATLRR